MNFRKRLRERLDVTQRGGPNAPKVSNEEILNVLRRADDEYLTTTEVQEELPIGDQTSNRLNDLQKEGRVTRRKTGQGYLWALTDSEPETEQNPQLGSIIQWSAKTQEWSRQIWWASKMVGGAGVLLIILALSAAIAEIAVPIITWEEALAWGYLIAIVAAAFMGGAWLLRLAALVAPKAVERLLF